MDFRKLNCIHTFYFSNAIKDHSITLKFYAQKVSKNQLNIFGINHRSKITEQSWKRDEIHFFLRAESWTQSANKFEWIPNWWLNSFRKLFANYFFFWIIERNIFCFCCLVSNLNVCSVHYESIEHVGSSELASMKINPS